MRSRRLRRGGTILAATATLAVGAACEPPPPPPLFVVGSPHDLPDAAPGDGLCDAGSGQGCTLRAAVDEANAQGRGDIVVPGGSYRFDTPVEVTGALRITGETHLVLIEGAYATPSDVHVAAGGALTVEDAELWLQVTVDGAFVAQQVALTPEVGIPLAIGPTGTAGLQNSRVGTVSGEDAVVNAGRLAVDYSQVGGTFAFRFTRIDLGALVTQPGGATWVRSSWLPSGCVGDVPTSLGSNADGGATCGLDGPGDVSDAPPVIPSGTDRVLPPEVLLDAIPSGELGCGTTMTTDVNGTARPTDTDADGTAACEIGAIELTEVPTGP